MTLEIKNVGFAYEANNPVFDEISLSVKAGEVLCLLGPNGAGKTTLFKTILGLYKPHKGEIMLDGSNIISWDRCKIAHFMGYVPQNHIPPFPYRVMDVVLMGRTAHLKNYASPTKNDRRIARESLQILNISHLENKNYSQISGGERQLVLIARALTQTPKFLVLDEPTANLDFGNQVRVLSHIKKLAEKGLGVIMSSHFPDDAFQYSNKVAMMKDGQIYRCGTPAEVLNEENLHSIYGINVQIAEAYSKTGEGYKVCIPVVA